MRGRTHSQKLSYLECLADPSKTNQKLKLKGEAIRSKECTTRRLQHAVPDAQESRLLGKLRAMSSYAYALCKKDVLITRAG